MKISLAAVGALAACLVAASGLVAPAGLAADLPNRLPPPVYYPPTPIFTWTGVYVGVNGGFGFGKFTGDGDALFGDASGGMIGGTAGYNHQIGRFVIGLEGDIDFTGVDGKQTFPGPVVAKSRLDGFGTVRARAGLALDRALLFVTGGYAGASISSSITPIGAGISDSVYHNGFAIGAGLEYAITPNWSAKAEYLYTRFEQNPTFAAPNTIQNGLSLSSIRGGVNYRF